MSLICRQTFDCRDALSCYSRDWKYASPRWLAVNVNRTSAAGGNAAAILSAGQIKCVAQDPKQRSLGVNIDSPPLPVQFK
jgi:hypothetical protein